MLRALFVAAVAVGMVVLMGSEVFSSARTSAYARTVFAWLYPDERWTWNLHLLTLRLRTVGHVLGYGLLTLLVLRGVHGGLDLGYRRACAVTLGVVALLAVLDESRQAWLPQRDGSVGDALLDIGIAAFALSIAVLLHRGAGRHPGVTP